MPKSKKKHIAPEQDYEAFVKGLKLIGLALNQCAADIDRVAYFELQDKKEKATRNVKADYAVDYFGDDFFDAIGNFHLTIGTGAKDKLALEISCTIEAHLHTEVRYKHEHAKHFAESDLRVLLWPYFRQFVTDTTARMWIPPVTIPLSADTD